MTSTIAIIGKSGSGKTTVATAMYKLIRRKFPTSSVLLIDNDLTLELSESFGIKSRNTIYGIKSGKHEYKTGIPDGMSKQEFIEWALEDIIFEADEYTDVIASWLVTPKDCICPSTRIMREALKKLVQRYDFAIFDCEYDLKYLNSLIDIPIDETVIVSKSSNASISLASKIYDSSKKYACEGKLEILLNKVKKEHINEAMGIINALELDLIGCIEKYENKDDIVKVLEVFYSRMNLPQSKD